VNSTLHDLHQAIGGQLQAAAEPQAVSLGDISTDSREAQPGSVFWGLKGAQYDGDDFAAEAFERGAVGAVVSKSMAVPAGRWAIQVPDTFEALRRWAAWKRGRFTGAVIGVTGSVGKTTTRQMIHTALASRLRGTASPRNYNNQLGVPLSMTRIEADQDYAVLELGASRRGEIASLAQLAAPKIGVITHVGDAHLSGFGGRHGVAVAKAELLSALPPDGHAVLGDDPWLRRLASCCRAAITWVGRTSQCDLVADDVRATGGRLEFNVRACPFVVPVWGRHHLTSALLAIATARLFGLDLKEIAEALARFESVPMRCQVCETRGATIINDTYNASPTAMQAALELLRDFDAPGKRIVVCGEMAELGGESSLWHHRLGTQIVSVCRADVVIACGEHARDVVAGARAAGMPRAHAIPCRSADETLPYLGQTIQPGDVVLVKGARFMGMERVVSALAEFPKRRSA
jgi:UDP-N-acetylmuramoyl-tripeptide--D-alanyl-D-alanine ligase